MQQSTADLVSLGDDPHVPPPDDRPPAFNHSLRIALAMKGGISLAVWIGGAVAEFDLLRRIRILGSPDAPRPYLVSIAGRDGHEVQERARHYASLLIAARVDQVEFDVLAGASAGGLNAVLFGVAQRAGASFDSVLTTWLDAGAIWNLLHKPWSRGHTSALDGDGYFFPAVVDAITGLQNSERSEDHRPRAVTIELSGTVSDAEASATWGFQTGRGHFRFTGRDGDAPDSPAAAGREIPTGPVAADPRPVGGTAVERLAYAARTTSSFPGAFEPARILSRPLSDEARLEPPADVAWIGFDFAFSHHRPWITDADVEQGRLLPFRAVDGGTIDNIPIDRALRSVRDMPAEDFVSRSILYLEPDPDAAVARDVLPSAVDVHRQEATPPSGSRLIDNIRTTLRLRGIRESGDEEIDQLERYRRERYLWQGRRESFTALRPSYDRERSRAAYARYRSTADLSLLSDALTDPAVWQLGSDLPTRTAVPAAKRELIVGLDAIFDTYDPDRPASVRSVGISDGPSDPALVGRAVHDGPQAVLDGVACALAWLREIELAKWDRREGWFDAPAEARRTAVRRSLYALAGATRLDRDRAIHAALVASTGTDAAGPILGAWVQRNADAVDEARWQALDAAIAEIVAIGELLPEADRDDIPWTRFAGLRGATARDLAPYTAPIGIPSPVSSLRFDVISANERGQVDERFEPLQLAQASLAATQWMSLPADERATAMERYIRERRADPGSAHRLLPLTKLAGTILWSFGAFFAARWRTNDWWWGRLDAAAGISRILGARARLDGETVATTARDVQESVLREAGGVEDARLRPYTGDRIDGDAAAVAARMTSGGHRLRNLPDGYLLAVGSRATRAVLRAAIAGRGLASKVAIAALLPPLLINLPFAFSPLRGLAVAVTIGAVVSVVGSGGAALAPVGQWGFGIGVGALALVLVVLVVLVVRTARSLAEADRIRRGVVETLSPDDTDLDRSLRAELTARGARARTLARRLLAGAIAAIVVAVVLTVLQGGAQPGAWCLALIAVLALGASARAARRFDPPRGAGGQLGWIVVAAIALAAIVASWWIAKAVEPVPPIVVVAVLVGMVGAVGALALTIGWLPSGVSSGGRRRYGLVLWLVTIVATSVVAGGAAALIMGAFRGEVLIAQPAAAGLTAWLLGSQAFWWLSESAAGDNTADVDDGPIDDIRMTATSTTP